MLNETIASKCVCVRKGEKKGEGAEEGKYY